MIGVDERLVRLALMQANERFDRSTALRNTVECDGIVLSPAMSP
jgi:hypothetical protein